MATLHWIWQEHDGRPIKVTVKPGQNPDVALAKKFDAHEAFRKTGKDKRSLRNFLPEVTPGVLRLFSDGAMVWSSDALGPLDAKVSKDGRKVEVTNDQGVTLTLKCFGRHHAESLAKMIVDGVQSFDTRCL